jgi:hypothetical protein
MRISVPPFAPLVGPQAAGELCADSELHAPGAVERLLAEAFDLPNVLAHAPLRESLSVSDLLTNLEDYEPGIIHILGHGRLTTSDPILHLGQGHGDLHLDNVLTTSQLRALA